MQVRMTADVKVPRESRMTDRTRGDGTRTRAARLASKARRARRTV